MDLGIYLEDMEDLFSNSPDNVSCFSSSLLGFRTLEYRNAAPESMPLLHRSIQHIDHYSNLQLPEAAQIVAAFEPEKLHKYSSGMQAVEFQYLKGGRGSLRTREQSSSVASIYIPPITAPTSTT